MAHVFISYVRQNRDAIDRLANELRNKGVTIWLDRDNIDPGARWRDAIKNAIQSGSFFMACFSKEYDERVETYMNEELTIAIDELRERPSAKTWFIPILMNETQIPLRRISTVEELSDIQAINLHEDWDIGINRILRVIRYDDPALARIWKLLDILDVPFSNERRHAIEQLGNIQTAENLVIAALIKATQDNDLEIKKASLEALGKIGPAAAAAVPALVVALNDPKGDVRKSAAMALGKIGPAAVPTLVAALNGPEERVRANAARALGEIGPAAAAAVPALVATLNDPERDVRSGAVEALGKMGPAAAAAAAVPALIAASKDSDPLAKLHIFWAVQEIKQAAAAVPTLAAAVLNGPEERFRASAAETMQRIHNVQKS